jgi:two-component system, chemotaxis family, chemotaxis protein CheY
MKILIVDNSATMRRIVHQALRPLGAVECVEASTHDDGILACDATIDAVIVDCGAADGAGVRLVQALRARRAVRAIPVLMMTARAVCDDMEAVLSDGVSNYIVKPFTPAALQQKLTGLFSTQRYAHAA